MNLAKVLQDNLALLAEIQRRHSQRADHSERTAQFDAESRVFRRRIEQNLIEISDKLNRLLSRDVQRPSDQP